MLSGCFLIDNKTAILSTDRPEVAAYVEIFNASQSEYRIELVYSEQPWDSRTLYSQDAPDIVISRNLAANTVITAFNPLTKLIEKELFDPSTLYQPLYATGTREGVPYVLPLSFNLPAVIYRQGAVDTRGSALIITPEQMKSISGDFNSKSTDRFRVKGFVPSWSEDFIYYNSVIQGTSYGETADGSTIWNNENLTASAEFCRDWTENLNSGYAEETDFTLTYCYDPGYKLLNAERIGFSFTTLRDFLSIPAEERTSLEFKWFGGDGFIPVCDDINYIGIPKESSKKKTAEAFLVWMLSADTQRTLLESAQFKRLRVFGICDGLSTISEINEKVIPEYYTRLIGLIPPSEYLRVPASLPADWDEIRDGVFIPWLMDQISETPRMPAVSDRLRTWLLQEKKN